MKCYEDQLLVSELTIISLRNKDLSHQFEK